jgi:BolA protein
MENPEVMDRMKQLLAALEPQELEIRDDSHHHAGHPGRGSGGHYQLHLVSKLFQGKNTLACHRMIYNALSELMPGQIHALTIHCRAS